MNISKQRKTAIVVGAGIMGLTTALALKQAGFSVRIIEKGEPARQASWAGGGILSPLYPWQAPPEVWAIAEQSLAQYPRLCADLQRATGIDPEWYGCGMAILQIEQAAQALAWSKQTGFAVEQGAVDIDGCLHDGLFMPWIAQVRNPRLCKALLQFVQQQGVEVLLHQPAQLRCTQNRAQVVVADQVWDADVVVVAAGAWSNELTSELDWPLAIAPVLGQMLMIAAPPTLLKHIVLKNSRYLIPRRDGRVLVGSTVESVGFALHTTPAARQELLDFAYGLCPSLANYPVERHWAGLRPGTADGVPIITRHPQLANLYVNAGQHRNGITLALGSAQQLLQRIAE